MRADDLQLWGGIECTVNRVGDRYHDQFFKSGHVDRLDDLDRVANLGIRTLRYPVLWERTAPDHPEERDWSFSDERLGRLEALGIDPIVGLVHHGSGPRYTNLMDGGFAPGLASHARAVAERYPWVEAYTPVNEPLTTARFSGLYGHWYPHATDERSFARALLNQVKAVVLSMEAVREVNPNCRLVQTDDLGKTFATGPLGHQAEFDNVRRWLTWDLLCGHVLPGHRMWDHFVAIGVDERELAWFAERPCPPDVVGVNYYATSERFLDHRIDRYPPETHGGNANDRFADVEAVRVLAGGMDGPTMLLMEAWERYRLPIAITECHLGCTREEQVRWLAYVWNGARSAKSQGADVRAVAVWSLFGAHDWCSLLTSDAQRYEPGAFDLRAPEPRETAIAGLVRTLASGGEPDAAGEGWWERPIRLMYPPVLVNGRAAAMPTKRTEGRRRPLAVVGDQRGLAELFAEHCEVRGLANVLVARDPSSLRQTLLRLRPWAVIDIGGVEDPSMVPSLCASIDARLVVLSDADVFDGEKRSPYVENDPVRPVEVSGQDKVACERLALRVRSETMVVRVGDLFGLPRRTDFVAAALDALRRGLTVSAAADRLIAPAYAPHVVGATLDLLADRFTGIVHLANEAVLSPASLARRIARAADLDERLVREVPQAFLSPKEGPSLNRGLQSERAWPLPCLDEALSSCVRDLRPAHVPRMGGYTA